MPAARVPLPLVAYATALCVAHACVARAAAAQTRAHADSAARRPVSVSVSAGVFRYDLAGSGTAPLAAARVHRELAARFVAEGGVGLTRTEERLGARVTYLLPEIQLQLQRATGRTRPYVGAGGGWLTSILGARGGGDATFSFATGLRTQLGPRLGARADLRARAIGNDFKSGALEATLGLSWPLRP